MNSNATVNDYCINLKKFQNTNCDINLKKISLLLTVHALVLTLFSLSNYFSIKKKNQIRLKLFPNVVSQTNNIDYGVFAIKYTDMWNNAILVELITLVHPIPLYLQFLS